MFEEEFFALPPGTKTEQMIERAKLIVATGTSRHKASARDYLRRMVVEDMLDSVDISEHLAENVTYVQGIAEEMADKILDTLL